jgi:tRNA A37 methylthiotransferase MiaB
MPIHNTFAVKKERLNELKALNNSKKMAYMLSHIDKTLEIIVEKQGVDDSSIGTSSNYLKVKTYCNRNPKGSLVRVRISGIEKNFLKGYSVENF